MKHTFTTWVAILLMLSLLVGCSSTPTPQKSNEKKPTNSATTSQKENKNNTSTPEQSTTSQPASSVPQETTDESTSSTASQPKETVVVGTRPDGLKYNADFDIDDNVFMDALIYTGYNMKKHRADGMMWTYILSADKRGMGYLSDITYGGGSSGLETTSAGLPDIAAFERGGLVCASFATYVYFNYLPNVAGIDTSPLTKPEKTYNAHSFYTAAKDWITKGYSYSIGFKASRTSYNYINFTPDEEIPIGSIIVFEDDRKHDGRGSHITVYAGHKNDHHWVYQVGTSNGPEMCAVERMLFGPDPQWPLMVISAPTMVYENKK